MIKIDQKLSGLITSVFDRDEYVTIHHYHRLTIDHDEYVTLHHYHRLTIDHDEYVTIHHYHRLTIDHAAAVFNKP